MKHLFFLLFTLFINTYTSTFAQSIPNTPTTDTTLNYARQIIDTLCSKTMLGRGYVNFGNEHAAQYIQNEFKKWNLQPIENQKYTQPFFVNVNTFPSNLVLKINNKTLNVGRNFLIKPNSPTFKGEAKIKKITEKQLLNTQKRAQLLKEVSKNKYKNHFLWFDYQPENAKNLKNFLDSLKQNTHAKGFLTTEYKKLTWHIASQTATKPECIVFANEINTKKTPKKLFLNIENEFKTNYEINNIIACVKGTQNTDSVLVFSAHFDHLGAMGNTQYVPGANDNASGIALLLNLAQYFSKNPLPYTVVFIAFNAEELGLLGSKHYTENPFFELNKIKFLVNIDMVGTGEDGITVVNAEEFKNQYNKLLNINATHNYLPNIYPRGKAANSDHYPFYEKGVPCFFIYTRGGIAAYHDIDDRAQTLPLTKFNGVKNLLIDFSKNLQK